MILARGHEIAARLLEAAGLLPATLVSAELPMPAADSVRIHRARDLLLADLRHPPSVTELARRTGTNPRKLTEQFRAVFGLPPFAYLKKHRLERAFHSLQRGTEPIATIAAEVGYRPGHLSSAFRAQFGYSPRECRTSGLPIT